eukprot:2521658-Pyramimonas_sp.AAC.1
MNEQVRSRLKVKLRRDKTLSEPGVVSLLSPFLHASGIAVGLRVLVFLRSTDGLNGISRPQ